MKIKDMPPGAAAIEAWVHDVKVNIESIFHIPYLQFLQQGY